MSYQNWTIYCVACHFDEIGSLIVDDIYVIEGTKKEINIYVRVSMIYSRSYCLCPQWSCIK